MKRFSQTLKVVLALFVAVFSNGLLPTTAAYAATNPPGNNGTIKINDEDISAGHDNDPILDSCTVNVKWYGFDSGSRTAKVTFEGQGGTATSQILSPQGTQTETFTGSGAGNVIDYTKNYTLSFTGAAGPQGYHVKVTIVTDGSQGNDTKSKVFWAPADCQATVSAQEVIVKNPCGKDKDFFFIPVTNHVSYKYKIGNGPLQPATEGVDIPATAWGVTYTATAIAEDGYLLSGSATQEFQFTNAPCTVVIPIPEAPKPNDPCGLNNATWVAPKDSDSIHWSIVNGHLIATAQDGYLFSGNKTSVDYGVAPDSGKLCVIDIPQKPETIDPCGGPHNAYWVIPESTDKIDWSLNQYGELIATAKAGYIFSNGKTVINFGKAKDSNTPCVKVIPVPSTPEVKDQCGLNNAQWIVPHDTFQIDWSLNYKGELIATAKSGYVFANEEHSHNFGKVVDSGKLCPAKPETPKFVDYCGERTDYVIIPSTKGVTYKINGVKASAGYHAASGSVAVTAVAANEDYILVGDEKGPWTHEFTEAECVTITKSSQPVTDTNGDGGIGVGDIVTWNITVTNNSDNDLDNFRIELNDNTATIVDNASVTDGVIKYLKHGTSVSVTATSKLTDDDVKACKATNVVTFQGWYTRKHHEIDKYGREDTDAFSLKYNNHDSDEEDEYDLSGSSNTATAEFTCPTPGSGNGGETPTETPSEETPAVLPSTGPAGNGSPLMAIIAAVVAYGATYFMQRRREITANS